MGKFPHSAHTTILRSDLGPTSISRLCRLLALLWGDIAWLQALQKGYSFAKTTYWYHARHIIEFCDIP